MIWRERSRGWGLLSLVFLASGVLTLGEGSIALLLPPLLEQRGSDAGLIGGLISLYGVASLASRVPGGLLYRSERAALLVGGGCLATAVAFFLIPVVASPVLVGALLAVQGFGFGIATTAVMALIMERAPRRVNTGSVMAWYAGSTGLGYAAAGFVGGRLGDVLGLGLAIQILGFVPVSASVVLIVALVRSRPAWEESHPPDPPSDAGSDAPITAAEPHASASGPLTDPEGDRAESAVRRRFWDAFRGLPPLVWVAFLVAFYLNLTYGALNAFFPIHGLAIGLTLTQVGLLIGVHSSVASAIRFLSGPIFRWVSYERVLTSMVLLSGVAVVGIGLGRGFALLAIAWGAVGFARGLLRVASGALVMEASAKTDRARGAASSTYLAGLDLGRILGPALAGGLVTLTGIPMMLVAIAFIGPFAYLSLSFAVTRRA